MIQLLRCVTALLGALGLCCQAITAEPQLNFNRDVRPILSDKCFACHGQDSKQRQADLRLDIAPEPTSKAIVAGKPNQSSLVARIESTDVDEVMPPPKSHKQLSDSEKAILKRWIEQGANYEKHWAFLPPQKPTIPNGQQAIDYLIHKVLQQNNLEFSPEAAPEIWLRRVTLDLTGFPPTIQEVNDFLRLVEQHGPSAYAVQVDRLLGSTRYGERMAQEWLDVARYADTHGFNNDSARVMWRWRDWVIDAFNANMPYDQFITEQLAGDLLPNPTLEQRIATGFCRNHVINSEGGIIEEEYRVEYVADRVRTMSTAWLGLTMECSRCHDHKFDPISQRDYYSLFAFFNNVPEHGEDGRIANAVPMIPAPTKQEQQELAGMKTELNKLDAELHREIHAAMQTAPKEKVKLPDSQAEGRGKDGTELIGTRIKWKDAPKIDLPEAALRIDCETADSLDKVFKFHKQPPQIVEGVEGQGWHIGPDSLVEIAAGKINFGKRGTLALWIKPDADCPKDVAVLSSVNYQGNDSAQGFAKGHEIRLVNGEIEIRTNDTFPAYAIRLRTEGAHISTPQWHHLAIVMGGTKKAINIQIYVNGQPQLIHTTYDGLSGDSIAANATYNLGAERTPDAPAFRGCFDQLQFFASELQPNQLNALPQAGLRIVGNRTGAELDERMLLMTEQATDAARELASKRDKLWVDYIAKFRGLPTTMVMQELPEPRPTYVLKRGVYDAHGERVSATVPQQLIDCWPEGAPRNRLGLARWLTHPNHPLVSRVVVNRIWAQLFGTGIVKTLEDFGFQGEYPSHPELLDWLACELVESGWDIKQLMHTIVLSKTYRQSARVSSELYSRDPENRLLARAPRLRLSAEMLRDQSLALSGLLKERIGGPSVYPYQPEGLYTGLVVGADYPGTSWPTSQGDDRYRRTMYTFIKRTVPHPLMQTFDAPDREFCTARRMRTNTPLQALVLMNEPGFYEAAQQLGKRIVAEGGDKDEQRVAWAFQLVTARKPSLTEKQELLSAWQKARQVDPKTADAMFASVLLNLDETVTRP